MSDRIDKLVVVKAEDSGRDFFRVCSEVPHEASEISNSPRTLPSLDLAEEHQMFTSD